MKNSHQILLFYKYTAIEDPEKLRQEQRNVCQKLGLTGRIIVAGEGINGTVEGLIGNTQEYIRLMIKDLRFEDMHFKKSAGTGDAFPKLSVKVRPEIVSSHLGEGDINPNRVTGKYLEPGELREWFKSGKKFYIVDMRNDYEHEIGRFENSMLAPFTNFRDLPKVLEQLTGLKDQTVLTVCTGGVRCEKASGFLVNNGFKDVYQLYGGIVSYMEKYPNENFLGKLYVFDGRIAMGFNTDDPEHKIVGKCKFCSGPADTYRDCANIYCRGKRHFISCDDCFDKYMGFCRDNCPELSQMHD
ncbi:MAG TPA: rhodanese-related sulfurtransferase [Patescibacteria group bacterium]|nr:rhodanese-related sulfurtransferase [Patescibacteria group bacterium]